MSTLGVSPVGVMTTAEVERDHLEYLGVTEIGIIRECQGTTFRINGKILREKQSMNKVPSKVSTTMFGDYADPNQVA